MDGFPVIMSVFSIPIFMEVIDQGSARNLNKSLLNLRVSSLFRSPRIVLIHREWSAILTLLHILSLGKLQNKQKQVARRYSRLSMERKA